MIFTNTPEPRFVYQDLVGIRSDLQDIIFISNENIGISVTIVDAYKFSPEALDELLLTKIDAINTKKQQIVTILTNNYTNYAAGISGACGIGTTTTDITNNSDIMKVVVAGTAATFSYTRLGIGSTGARAEVREDTLYSWTYPAVENVNTSVTFYQEGETYLQITSGSLGIGKTDVLVSDVQDKPNVHESSTLIGYYYPITGSSPSCTAIGASITTLIGDIVSIRSDITSMLTDINSLKNLKVEKQLQFWYENLSLQDSINRLSEIENSISAMENNQQTIIDYTP